MEDAPTTVVSRAAVHVISLLVQDPNGLVADTGRPRVVSGRPT